MISSTPDICAQACPFPVPLKIGTDPGAESHCEAAACTEDVLVSPRIDQSSCFVIAEKGVALCRR